MVIFEITNDNYEYLYFTALPPGYAGSRRRVSLFVFLLVVFGVLKRVAYLGNVVPVPLLEHLASVFLPKIFLNSGPKNALEVAFLVIIQRLWGKFLLILLNPTSNR